MSVANRFTTAQIAVIAQVWQNAELNSVEEITKTINAKFKAMEGNTLPELTKDDVSEVRIYLKAKGFSLRNLSASKATSQEELDAFVDIWNSCESLAQVAEKMGVSVQEVKKLQMRCRGRKMEMKRMRERITKDDLASALSGIVEMKVEETTETTEVAETTES